MRRVIVSALYRKSARELVNEHGLQEAERVAAAVVREALDVRDDTALRAARRVAAQIQLIKEGR